MRSTNFSVQNKFTKGLITEATGLTFPEDACTDTDNCVFNHFGVVTRRPGFDFEVGASEQTVSVSGNVTTTYLWKNVAGEGDRTFVVVQVGDFLYFYNVTQTAPLSSGLHGDTVDLTDYCPVGTTSVANLECQFASGNGRLFVTNPGLNSFYVSYDPTGDNITSSGIDIQIRDFTGDTSDPSSLTDRPSTNLAGLNAHHRYNLENQGWTSTTLTSWDTARTDMPSNVDVSWNYKSAAGAFDFTTVANKAIGNSKAPAGHFIYNIYNFNRSSNVSGATDESITAERVSTCAFYAGRVWYAGLKSLNNSSRIFFTQIIENPAQYGKCYQTNDPTSETLFDLLPSDGGTLDILEAGSIIKMIPVQNSLLVFCTNGIWMVAGSQGVGFTANDYVVHKISSITNVSATSFVDVEGLPFWWNLEGIYTVKNEPQNNSVVVQSLTDPSIRQFFLDILAESKLLARGCYDQFTKRVQWIYRSSEASSFNDKYTFDKMLTLNLLSGAFYPWSVETSDNEIKGLVNIFGFSGSFTQENVQSSTVDVQDGGVQVITYEATAGTGAISTIKYLVSYPTNKLSFAECYSTDYLDWGDTEYDSYFITGYVVRGGGFRKFQENYVNVFSNNEETTSFKISGRWDYATSSNTGRWSASQTFTNQAGNYTYRPNRIKIRGHGLACQFKIYNNSSNPFNFIGWSNWETGNQRI